MNPETAFLAGLLVGIVYSLFAWRPIIRVKDKEKDS